MAILDDEAVRLLELMAALGQFDMASMTPQAVRSFVAQRPMPPGPEVTEIRNFAVPGPDGDIPVRLYRPRPAQDLPLLVWYHGGGMVIGSLETADWVSRSLCVQADTAVLSVDYRLAPEHKFPAAVEDSYAALVWAASHGRELGIDAARISVGGDSAGGTCAAVACLLAKARGGPQILSQLLVYPGTDRDLTRPSVTEFADGPILTKAAMLWFRGHYHADPAELLDPRANPALAESHEDLPRALVLTAEIDPIRDAGENYGRLLAQAGVVTTMKRYNGMFHGFFTMGNLMGKTREAVTDAAGFLAMVNTSATTR